MNEDGVNASWRTVSRCYRFEDRDGVLGRRARDGASVDELRASAPEAYQGCQEIIGNVALNAGLQYMIEALTRINPAAVLWDATNAQIVVGDQSAPAEATQTQLEAQRLGTNWQAVGMDAGFPQREGQTMIFRSSFLSGVAVHDWLEWGVSNGVVLLNRKVDNVGTKPEFDLWIFEVGITWT